MRRSFLLATTFGASILVLEQGKSCIKKAMDFVFDLFGGMMILRGIKNSRY
jgi:hypothetical protein